MITQEHIKKSKQRTGDGFEEVHEWLDNCICRPYIDYDKYPMQHRVERHNVSGLLFIKEKFGEEAYREGKYHLLEDGVRI